MEPQQNKMIHYSDSSGEEDEEPGTRTSLSSAKGGRGSVSTPPQNEESKAKVRFRYNRGTGGALSLSAAEHVPLPHDVNLSSLHCVIL